MLLDVSVTCSLPGTPQRQHEISHELKAAFVLMQLIGGGLGYAGILVSGGGKMWSVMFYSGDLRPWCYVSRVGTHGAVSDAAENPAPN